MKNVYRKGKVHPQPAPDAYSVLRLLPVAVATLSAALPAEDREVLAYLIARSPDVLPLKDNRRNTLPLSSLVEKEKASQQFPWSHGPSFECSCFQCYTSFWSRWDASPNRQTIHEAIDLYEEHMAARADAAKGNSKGKNRKGFKDKNPRHSSCADESFPPPVANDKSVVSVVQIEEEALKAALKQGQRQSAAAAASLDHRRAGNNAQGVSKHHDLHRRSPLDGLDFPHWTRTVALISSQYCSYCNRLISLTVR
ncbi:hypothetical protein SUGI_0513850 [Cryptomeria japonica]|nr:hypothetical protein SUGI_0513850 [Cryptomeria japonica]